MKIQSDKRYLIWSTKSNMTSLISLMDYAIRSTTTKEEMYYWSLFVKHLLNFNNWADVWQLKQVGEIQLDGFTNPDVPQTQMLYVFNSTNGSIPASQVMNHIITPYLFSEATKKKN